MIFLALLRKELHGYCVAPLFYVLAATFLGLGGFFFYTRLVFFTEYGLGENILGNFWLAYLAGAPYSLSMLLLLVIPLLTMRLFADERRHGTLELLLTYPVRDADLWWAKFAGCAVVCAVLLAGTLVYPLALTRAEPLPLAVLACGYAGLYLLALSFVACGMFFSSLTDNQVVAAVATLGVLIACWMLNWNEAAAAAGALPTLASLSMFDHFESFARGAVGAEDVTYFLSCIAFFGFCTLRSLEARAWHGKR